MTSTQKDEIAKLKAALKSAQEKNNKLQDKYEKAKDDKKSEEEEKAKLERALASATGGRKALMKWDDDTAASVQSTFKHKVFCKVKFVLNMEQLEEATKLCLLEMPGQKLDVRSKDPEMKAAVAAWVDTYKGDVRSQINKQRSYVQNQLKDAAQQWYDTHDKPLPTWQQLEQIALRSEDLDLEDEDTQEMLLFYVDSILPKVAGSKFFPKNVRCYYTISDAKTGSKEKGNLLQFVPAGMWSFLVLMLENCRPQWECFADLISFFMQVRRLFLS